MLGKQVTMFYEITMIPSLYVYVNKLECLSSDDKKFCEIGTRISSSLNSVGERQKNWRMTRSIVALSLSSLETGKPYLRERLSTNGLLVTTSLERLLLLL
jgi:hypothetical protein